MTGEVYFFCAKNTAYLLKSPSKIRNETCLAIQCVTSLPNRYLRILLTAKTCYLDQIKFCLEFDLNLDAFLRPRRFVSSSLETLHFEL